MKTYSQMTPEERSATYTNRQGEAIHELSNAARNFAAHYLVRINDPNEPHAAAAAGAVDRLMEAAFRLALAFSFDKPVMAKPETRSHLVVETERLEGEQVVARLVRASLREDGALEMVMCCSQHTLYPGHQKVMGGNIHGDAAIVLPITRVRAQVLVSLPNKGGQ